MMRIAMLGWEFPPFISGGLGTACFGLTRSLDAKGHEVLFVLPRPVHRSGAQSHIKLITPEGHAPGPAPGHNPATSAGERPTDAESMADEFAAELQGGQHGQGGQTGPAPTVPGPFGRMRMLGVPAAFSSPYGGGAAVGGKLRGRYTSRVLPDGTTVYTDAAVDEASDSGVVETVYREDSILHPLGHTQHVFGMGGAGAHYQGDLFLEAERYAKMVVGLTRGENFDVIHAHDWLTFPAGIALARASGKPLVVHVHSTEFDRSGDNINQRVYDVERRGMMAAVRVVAVSELTRNICTRRYGLPTEKIDIVYNGIENDAIQPQEGRLSNGTDKIVLFLGRITMQKGPEYFIAAAKLVLEKVPEAKFIIAGTGDMEARMIELAAHYHIGHRVLFTGFLRGKDVDRVYRMADCYVMPSVSEPFGIAPLEAMRHDVPTIISKQSGVGEVLTHVLKVDFWDTQELANKIVAVLRHPPLSQTLRDHGSVEVKKLTWSSSADACIESYKRAISDHVAVTTGIPAAMV